MSEFNDAQILEWILDHGGFEWMHDQYDRHNGLHLFTRAELEGQMMLEEGCPE